MMHSTRLPYPPPLLNPNVQAHWVKKYKAKKQYKNQCLLELMAAKTPKRWAGPVFVEVEFVVPDRRKRDKDNIIAGFKSGLDAISAHIGIDDSEFDARYSVVREPVKNGAMNVSITDTQSNWQAIGNLAQNMVKGAVT